MNKMTKGCPNEAMACYRGAQISIKHIEILVYRQKDGQTDTKTCKQTDREKQTDDRLETDRQTGVGSFQYYLVGFRSNRFLYSFLKTK